jgi:hypothetical protein
LAPFYSVSVDLKDASRQPSPPFAEPIALFIVLYELNGRFWAVAHPVFRGTAGRR